MSFQYKVEPRVLRICTVCGLKFSVKESDTVTWKCQKHWELTYHI